MITVLAMVCCLVSGTVHAPSGAPVTGAQVVLRGSVTEQARTDAAGRFTIQTPAGTYRLQASRAGYVPVTVAPVDVNGDTNVAVILEPADTAQLRTIGTVTVNGRLARVAGAIPSVAVTRADLERTGSDRITEGLLDIPSLDLQYPHNAGSSGLATVSLRGPDPSETMITLDGQLLNDANTGDVDVSQLPVAAFSALDVSEGLGPQDLEGSSTIGGAVNLISLQPTRQQHAAFSVSAGSFGESEEWLNTTGSSRKLGYAFALDNQRESGYVNGVYNVCSFDLATCAPQFLGSSRSQQSALANLTYSFSEKADVDARVFTLADLRDESAGIAGIDAATGALESPGAQTFSQGIRAYQLRGRSGLGSGELVALLSRSDDNVDVAGGGVGNPMYDLSHADTRTNESLLWGRTFQDSSFSFGGYFQQERFIAVGAIPQLSQSIASYFGRGAWQPAQKLHLGASIYLSQYSTFGSNPDGRLSAVYDTDPRTSVRFSAGTGFRAPLLIERYVFADSELPPPDDNCVITGQGNPRERPEHATEYELGASHQFGSNATLDASLYRTNLRDPIENYYPGDTCPSVSYSYPINVGNAVYEGAEVRYVQRFPRAHTFITAMYGLNVAYPKNMPVTISNPTSGAFIVNNEQFPDIPQQQASLEGDWTQNGWHAAAIGVFRGKNNPLNQPPVVFVDAALGHAFGEHFDLTLAGTNLFNAAAGRFQVFNGGEPYYGITSSGALGPLPTNLLTTEPAGVRIILTVRN